MSKKVIHINSSTYRGPGRVMTSIVNSLELAGLENIIITPNIGDIDFKDRIKLKNIDYYISRILSKFFHLFQTSNIPIEPEVYCKSKLTNILRKLNGKKVDFIILYWYKNTLSIKDAVSLTKKLNAKLFIYLMDNGPMTGACHYPGKCSNYLNGCGSCPSILWGLNKYDITRSICLKERKMLESVSTTILCPTTTSLSESQSSYKFRNLNCELLMIPLGDDYSLPISKIDCRKYFGLQSEDLYILVGAYSLSDKRKGMDYLIESLKIVSEKLDAELMSNIHLLVVGNAENVTFLNLGFKCTFLNYLNHHDLIMAYKAADFYISPSINDMGPMMVSESVKSGTPVVSFDIGVAKDLIVNRKTGFIVNLKDAKLMADAIIELITLDREKYIQMSETCAKLGVSKLSYDVFNSNLIRIFS